MMSNSKFNFIRHVLFYFLAVIIISETNSQEIVQIKIGEVIKGSLSLDESHKYYQLTIPKNESNRILILTTSEDSSTSQNSKDSFSDPDFYISKVNRYPSSRQSSEWYSENYGSDILTIPAESVGENDEFYIGMYCQYKCRYFLKIETAVETEIKLNEYNYLRLKPKETMNYKIVINKPFDTLKVMGYSANEGKFKMYMNQASPSSANSYDVIPSWESGYVILIKKGSRNYCTNCEYHVILHNEGNDNDETNTIIFYAGTEDENYETNLEQFNKVYDAMEENSKSSYNFNITYQEKRKEKLIIDIVVYTGTATLFIEGWRNKNLKKSDLEKQSNYVHNIFMEKYIILDYNDFSHFDKEDNYYSSSDSILHLCLYSSKKISYSIEVYYLSQITKYGPYRTLMPGFNLKGYLLKDQILAYELYNNDLKYKKGVEANITVTVDKVSGSVSAYGFFSKDDEDFSLDTIEGLNKLERSNKLILPLKDYNPTKSTISIPYTENVCLKNPTIKLENGNVITCTTYLIIKCDKPNEDKDMCVFDLQYTVKDTEIKMKPKQIYKGIIYEGKVDRYKISITDDSIDKLIIVLNSDSGDAQLSVYLEGETSDKKETFLSLSSNVNYIPDVVKISPKDVKKENLVGKYLVKVKPETYSSYQLYYYVVYKKGSWNYYLNNLLKVPEVNMNLYEGILMLDFFPNDIRYKIYSYTPSMTKKQNVKIFINRVNIDFNIYVFTDISTFEIEQLSAISHDPQKEPVKGYQYKSNTNNEVIIPKAEFESIFTKTFYIVIVPSNPLTLLDSMTNLDKEEKSKEDLDSKAVSKFYIGVTTESIPLYLIEGMPHIMTLSNSYSSQLYNKYINPEKENFEIILNILMGEVDIFVSKRELNETIIDKIDKSKSKYNLDTNTYSYDDIIYQLNVNTYSSIVIEKSFMDSNKKKDDDFPNILVYYYIRRTEAMKKDNKICQFMVIEQLNENVGQVLLPGTVQTGELEVGTNAHFIIEEIEKRRWAYINVIFKKGSGNVYLRIPEVPESHSNIRFPDEGYHDYKGKLIYSGRIIQIPENEFKKLETNHKLQFLITITGETGTENVYTKEDENGKEVKEVKSEIEYTISYSNEPKRINQNEPYDGFITQGEFQYFNLYFDKSTQNIYIGLSNMNGDADMYLRKGRILPSTEQFDWSSTESGHEYIDIGKDDKFFITNRQNISGYYTLLLVGFVDTSYSLFVSSHEKKVFPLRNNIPMTCWCENAGEKCFFRYSEVYNGGYSDNKLDHNDIIFTTQYLYGNGYMYSKVMDDSEIHNSVDFYKNFPDSKNYEYSNKESNQRNYIKVTVKGDKYNKDSSILLTFECREKTKVDLTSTSLTHFSSVEYIQENRENIFYLGKNHVTQKLSMLTLIFNNNMGKEQDLIYSVHSYIGDAHVKIYGNTSTWDVKSQKVLYESKLLNEFDLITNDDYQDENIDVYNPYTHDYHNYIPKEDKSKYDDIYFYIQPMTEFGFYIQCNFDKNWNKLQIGKSQTYFVANQEFFGYFDITEEYENMEFFLSVENNLKMFAEVFIKINTIDKNQITQLRKNPNKKNDEFSLYHYIIPTDTSYDYKGTTDRTLGKLAINLNKLPKLTEKEIEKGNKFVRALFYIRLGALNFQPLSEDNDPEDKEDQDNTEKKPVEDEHENTSNEIDNNHAEITLSVIPGINKFKYMELKPYEYHFSNLTYIRRQKHKPVETKVYSLTRENEAHDIMIIEISTCVGYYSFNIQDKIITQDNYKNRGVEYVKNYEKGKDIYIVENLKSKHYYVSVRPLGDIVLCRHANIDRENCGRNLQYLIYYYTTYTDNLSFENVDKWITHSPYGKGKVKLDLPIAITKDLESKAKSVRDYKFDVFATVDKDYTDVMSNICYLSRMTPNKEKIFLVQNINTLNKNSIVVKGLEPGKKYYMNVLVQNKKTKELLLFHPIEVRAGNRRRSLVRLLLNILILIIICLLIYFIYIYRKTREELIFLKGEAVAKTEHEMSGISSMQYDSQGVKYSTLSSGY